MINDTIAAIATPLGAGGIGIIRISGDDAEKILGEIFFPASEKSYPRMMKYGHVKNDEGEIIDEVLAVFMRAPHTYTAEDVAEIYCHGSIVALKKILALILTKGARLAERGEFTKRAFLNGRLDLSQAEAVMDLIDAKSEKAYDFAMDQLEGGLSGKLSEIRAGLTDVLVEMAVNIDYPDEDIEELTYEKLEKMLQEVRGKLDILRKSADTGKIVREGIGITIAGRPNVGKSSLMNKILGESRAIVTDIAGTTRDTIEEQASIRGITVRLTDTAGIRGTSDVIEKIGIEKSRQAIDEADIIIFVLDSGEDITPEDEEIIGYIGNRKVMVLLNKSDLTSKITESDISGRFGNARIIKTNMLTGEGLSAIGDEIERMVFGEEVQQSDRTSVTNTRHIALIESAFASIEHAIEALEMKEPLDIIEIDVKDAYDEIGEITGETATDDIINEVFSRFCLGK